MDLQLFRTLLQTDSTSGKERGLALLLMEKLRTSSNAVRSFEVGDGTLNLLFSWGSPKLYFCTHLDTVPPYIPPTFEGVSADAIFTDNAVVRGRGACDAKGQIFSMFEACKVLEKEGFTDFGLLLLSGEETGSFGAKAYTRDCEGGQVVIVGEPTDNVVAIAAMGTRSFAVRILGTSCHSGYPQQGASAVRGFVDFMNRLDAQDFPLDPLLGETTYNVGKLSSDNPQNILSGELNFRLYFRTTFASHQRVIDYMMSVVGENIEVQDFGGDEPTRFRTFSGFPSGSVSFGSDAPQLHKFAQKILCGPGSILVAHTRREFVRLRDIQTAIDQYVKMAKEIL